MLSENEGKVVIVPGTLDAELPFVDQETGIILRSIVNYRNVEKLSIREEQTGEGDKKEIVEYWEWNLSLNENEFGGSTKLFAPNTSLGEFIVAEELLEALGTNQHREEYTDKKELNQFGWNVFTDNGKTYLCQDEIMPDHEESTYLYYDKYNSYRKYMDTLRVSYESLEGNLDYTIIGLQQNGRLVKAPELDMLSVHEGVMMVDDLLAYNESSTKTAVITAIAIAVVLAGVGILLIAKSTKAAPAAKKKGTKGV